MYFYGFVMVHYDARPRMVPSVGCGDARAQVILRVTAVHGCVVHDFVLRFCFSVPSSASAIGFGIMC